MDKHLHLSIVTYIPEGSSKTRLEIKDRLIKSLSRADNFYAHDICTSIHIIVNNVNESNKDTLIDLKNYILHYIPSYKIGIDIIPNSENLLPDSRNRVIQKIYNKYIGQDNWIYQLDDDDEVTPEFFKIICSCFRYDLLMNDRLNFFLFRQIRSEGNLLMPKSMHLTELKDLYKPYFTWSSWNWIANVKWLVQNRILYPGLWLENAHLEDNFFNIRACLVQKDANLIMNATYIWDTMSTTTMSSWKGPHDEVLEYFKNKGAGFDIKSAFMITEDGYSIIESKEDISNVFIKKINPSEHDFVNESGFKVESDKLRYDGLTNRLYLGETVIKKIESLAEFAAKNSVYQLEMLAKFTDADTPVKKFLKESCEDIGNNKRKLKNKICYDPYMICT